VGCDQIRSMIDDYHYGELEKARAAEVAAHLRECEKCREELARLEDESQMYRTYSSETEKSLEVSPDLWKRVLVSTRQMSVEQPDARHLGSRSWYRFLVPASPWVRQAVAALLLVAMSVSITLLIVGHYRVNEGAFIEPKIDTAGSGAGPGLEPALQSIRHAEQEYLKAIAALDAVVEKQKSTLDPRILSEFQANLQLIDDNIAATRKAYYAHPRDTDLAFFMLAAYSRKVELLQNLTS